MRRHIAPLLRPLGLIIALLTAAAPTLALDDAHWNQAQEAATRGIAYLRSVQNEDGSWMPEPGPAVTGLVVAAMLDRPEISATDPAIAKAIAYILSKVQPDGGIHDGILQNYNTSICLSALSRINNRPEIAEVIARAQKYLVGLQWSDQQIEGGEKVGPDHPFYGGAGYGKHGRPDMSNTHFMVQALYDSGMDCNDPAFLRAVAFVARCQGTSSNTLLGDRIQQDGGFIYATSIDKDHVGVPESKANPELMDEAKLGKPVTNLRTYGSMTYAGFMTYLYADLDRDDPRVQDAVRWIRSNYTLAQNPGMPAPIEMQGYYYYLLTFAKAMDAFGPTTITDAQGQEHHWDNELVARLAELQAEDGSWHNAADRWMEGDPRLVTAYVLHALNHATR